MTIRNVLVDDLTGKWTFPASTAVAVGDLLFNNSGVAAKASAQADQGTEALNQSLFASLFIGVSQDQRLATETATGTRTVREDGVYDCTCPSTTWAEGDLVAASENAGGDGLENQQVEKTTDPACAIGYCVKAGASLTTVRVRLISRYHPESPWRAYKPSVVNASLAVAGGTLAIPVTHRYVAKTTGGAEALTLANGVPGQRLHITLAVDGGDGTLTPATKTGFATVVFADAGDQVELEYVNDVVGWILCGYAGTAAPPVIT